MEFYSYRGSIPPIAMRDCILAASSDVVRHLEMSEAAMSLQAPSYSYTAGRGEFVPEPDRVSDVGYVGVCADVDPGVRDGKQVQRDAVCALVGGFC